MAEVVLTLKNSIRPPLEASMISPDVLAGKSLSEIRSMKTWRGNRQVALEDVFDVKGDSGSEASGLTITVNGDLSKARRIGKGMTAGKLVVNGNAGFYLGERMKGGAIVVNGDVEAWTGVELEGGVIEVYGNTGDFLGCSFRGSRSGMKTGLIIVNGSAGCEVGGWMKDGVIKVKGDVGIFPGVHMQGGSILVYGGCAGRAGASMVGGRVVVMGRLPTVLPGFLIDEVRGSVKVGDERLQGPFYVFLGDAADAGNGRLFVNVAVNQHLKHLEALVP